jgi:hypothetical protein
LRKKAFRRPNIQWYHQNGVAGMYEEGDGWGSGGELDALKAYGA